MSVFLDAFARHMAPKTKLKVWEWMGENVPIYDSSQGSPTYAPDLAPWWKEPLEEIVDNKNKVVMVAAPTGSGKTTAFEGLIPYIIAEDPGGCLVAGQTDEMAKEWMETRLSYSLHGCEALRGLWPSDPSKKRKSEIIFPHMALFVGGSGMTRLQEKSIRWLIGDEVWKWKDGRIKELERRNHDRWNARLVLVSQGGLCEESAYNADMGSQDFAWWFNRTDQRLMRWFCPECGNGKLWEWSDVIYDAGDPAGARDWQALAQSVRVKCRECDLELEDKPENRRTLAMGGRYAATNPGGKTGHVGFRYPAMAVWWIEWKKLVAEWVEAEDAWKIANTILRRQFIQKRLAQDWDDRAHEAKPDLVEGSYLQSDVAGGEKLDGEINRIMAVDVQEIPHRHFWAAIRAFFTDGTSKLIWAGRLETWEMVEWLAKENGVNRNGESLVFVDAQHERDEVYEECAKRGNWVCLHGNKAASFPNRRGRETVHEFFTVLKTTRAPKSGRLIKYALWSSESVKDMLSRFRSGEAPGWEVYQDVREDYKSQMVAEVKKTKIDKATKVITRRWDNGGKPNHLWDCEAMILVGAMIAKMIAPIRVDEPEAEESVDR